MEEWSSVACYKHVVMISPFKLSPSLTHFPCSTIQADTQQAMTSLNDSLDSATNLLRRLDPAYQTARQANTTSSEIVQLPLPSTQDAQSLAQRINSSTVSQDQVSAILFSAESNRNKSQDLLTLAQNARYDAPAQKGDPVFILMYGGICTVSGLLTSDR